MVPHRILILWNRLPTYLLASIRDLERELDGQCEIVVISLEGDNWYPDVSVNYSLNNIKFLPYETFDPDSHRSFDLVLMSSWNFRKYRRLARLNTNACVVMAMDNQFNQSIKQLLLLVSKVGPYYIRNLSDYVFVAGERQAEYARLLGISSDRIINGAFSYDDSIFKFEESIEKQNRFCFVGRKVPAKGLDTLLSGYEMYRELCKVENIKPWELTIAGPGSIRTRLPLGVNEINYLSPDKAAQLMSRSRCFVLPSKYEPFGVVLTEAAASGCLLIASSSVGSADALIEENHNGYVFPVNSFKGLAEVMFKVTRFTPQQTRDGQDESIRLAQKFTPRKWSQELLETYLRHLNLKSE